MSATSFADTVEALRPPARPRSERMRLRGSAALLALTVALVAVRRAESPWGDTDVLWGARSGGDILNGAALPSADAYSWTAHGAAWLPNSWAWNVVLGIAYRLAGFAGIALLSVAALGVVGALLGVSLRRLGAPAAWGSLTAQIGLGIFAVFLYPRAQLTDYAAVVAIPLLATTALDGNRHAARRCVVGLILVQMAWMNLHSTAVIGPAMIVAIGVGRLLAERSLRRAARAALLTTLSAAASLATPYGLAPIRHLEQVRAASAGLISEWRPAGIGSPEQILALAAIALGVVAAAACYKRRAYDTLALLLLFGAMTAIALRFAPMLVLTAIPPLAAAAGRIPARRTFMNRICAAALVVLGVAAIVGAGSFADPGVQNASPALISAIPHGCRLVNDMTVGGAVILERPDVQVSIDSRNDMYGRQRELTALRVLTDGSYGTRYLDAHRVGCVLAPTADPLVRALISSPSWRRVGADGFRTLLVRTVAS